MTSPKNIVNLTNSAESGNKIEPNRRNNHVLVSIATADYLDMAKQFFASAYFNAGWDGDYLLLTYSIPETDLTWFREKGIIVRPSNPLYATKIGGMHPSLINKLYMFTPYFKQWQTVVYSDLDAIIRGPLDELKDIQGFCAVDDWSPTLQEQIVDSNDVQKRNLDKNNCEKIIAAAKRQYKLSNRPFCAGFFAFSTDIIEQNTFEELNQTIEKYHCISKFGDQLSLNFFFYDKWTKLAPTFNILVGQVFFKHPFKNNYEATTRWGIVDDLDAYILHVFNPKPWNSTSTFYQEWLSNLKRSEKIDLANIPNGSHEYLEKIRITEERINFREQVYRFIEIFGPYKSIIVKIVEYFYWRFIVFKVLKSEVSSKYYFFVEKFIR